MLAREPRGVIAFGGMQMRRVVTFALVLAGIFMAFGGIAPSRVRGEAAAIPARLTGITGLKQVQFGGYTFRVPGRPVYRLDRDPTQCVRYDRHAVYLGRPGDDQHCPAHLIGRTTTISVQAGRHRSLARLSVGLRSPACPRLAARCWATAPMRRCMPRCPDPA